MMEHISVLREIPTSIPAHLRWQITATTSSHNIAFRSSNLHFQMPFSTLEKGIFVKVFKEASDKVGGSL